MFEQSKKNTEGVASVGQIEAGGSGISLDEPERKTMLQADGNSDSNGVISSDGQFQSESGQSNAYLFVTKLLAYSSFASALLPGVFWFLAIVYVFGEARLLSMFLDVVPLWFTVITATLFPLVSATLGIVSLSRSEVGDQGRLMAWFGALVGIGSLLGLALWFIDDFLNPM